MNIRTRDKIKIFILMVCTVIGMHKDFVVYLQFDNLCAFARSSCQYYFLPLLDFSASEIQQSPVVRP
jgi:hypothetical protein